MIAIGLLVAAGILLLITSLAISWRRRVGDRRRLDVFAAQLAAEQRMDALTRNTLAEMRRIVRQAGREPQV